MKNLFWYTLCVIAFGLIGSTQGATVSVNSPQPANTVLAGPTSGGNDFPSFRAMVAADFTAGVINSAAIGSGAVVLTSKVTGILPIANGGTNGSTKQAGFDNLSPTAAKGDIAVFNGTNNVALNVGTNNFVLVADSTQATGLKWAAAGTGAAFSGLTGGTNTAAAMLIGTGASFGPTGSGTVTANQYVGTGSTSNAVDLQTAEVAGVLTNNKGGTGSDTSATGGAHNFVFQTSVGGAFTVAAPVEADLPATTAFTDVANIFSTVQTYQNYVSTQSATPTILSADAVGYDPGTVSYSRISSNASWNIRGIINGVNGRRLTMINVGSSPIILTHEDAAATAANRLHTPTGASMTLSVDYGVNLVYDSTDSRWRIVDIFQAAGGTGLTVPTGTSGGVPYYAGTGTIASSGLLAANQLIMGGGAGLTPASIGSSGTSTQVLHGNAGGAPTFGQIVNADITTNTIDMSAKMTGMMQAAQMPALTGDVTNTAGSLATTIGAGAVTATKMVNSGVFTGDATTTFPAITISAAAITAAKMVNGGVFTGDVTTTFPAITIGTGAITTGKIAANAVDMATKMTGTMLAGQFPALTGDVTTSAGSLATSIAASAVTTAKIAANAVDMATKMTGTMQAAQMPALTGDVTNTAGSLATTIANTAVTAAKMVNSGVFTGDATTTFPSIVIGTGAITTSKIGAAAVDLTTKVTGVLPIANGGSGQGTAGAAYNALAPSTAKGGLSVGSGTSTWANLPVGADNSVLTADSTQTNGVKWGTAGGATVIAPLVISGGSVAAGTAIAATTSDVNADFLMGASATTKTVLKLQTKPTNTAVAFEIQKSDGTIQYQLDNTTNSRNDITEKVQTANQSNIQMQSISENVTIAAAATSTSATNLLPANAFIVAVTFRVTTVIPTASTFSIGISGQSTLFGSGISTVNGTTQSSMKQTIPLNPFTNATASQVLITPNATPAGATGTLRVTVWYFTCQEPQN